MGRRGRKGEHRHEPTESNVITSCIPLSLLGMQSVHSNSRCHLQTAVPLHVLSSLVFPRMGSRSSKNFISCPETVVGQPLPPRLICALVSHLYRLSLGCSLSDLILAHWLSFTALTVKACEAGVTQGSHSLVQSVHGLPTFHTVPNLILLCTQATATYPLKPCPIIPTEALLPKNRDPLAATVAFNSQTFLTHLREYGTSFASLLHPLGPKGTWENGG